MRSIIVGFGLSLALILPASADRAQSEACASQLSEDGKMMYDEVAPNISEGADMQSVMKSELRDLVMSGKLSRSDARANAEDVGRCLWLINNTVEFDEDGNVILPEGASR